jgi:hypothetical protein
MGITSTASGVGVLLAEGTPCDFYSAIIGDSIIDRMVDQKLDQKPTPMATHKLLDELDITPYCQLYSH